MLPEVLAAIFVSRAYALGNYTVQLVVIGYTLYLFFSRKKLLSLAGVACIVLILTVLYELIIWMRFLSPLNFRMIYDSWWYLAARSLFWGIFWAYWGLHAYQYLRRRVRICRQAWTRTVLQGSH